jgi:hypothetical protein
MQAGMSEPIKTAPVYLAQLGYARAWLELESNVLAWHEALAATLVLQGGRTARTFSRDVVVAFAEDPVDFHEQTRRLKSLWSRELLHGPILMEPGSTQRFPIQMEVPTGIPFHNHVRLAVSISSGGFDRFVAAPVRVLPPAECRRLVLGLAEAGRMEVRRWRLRGFDIIEALLSPLPHPFARASLTLSLDAGNWYGGLTVFLEGRGLGRWFPKQHVIPISFLTHRYDRVRAELEQLFREAAFRASQGAGLPLPAERPEPLAADLPFPADHAGSEPADLPYPASSEGGRTLE